MNSSARTTNSEAMFSSCRRTTTDHSASTAWCTMVQKKQPAHRVKKKPNANNQEKLNCNGCTAAPIMLNTKAANATAPKMSDKPAKRPVSKYSPSGVGTSCC